MKYSNRENRLKGLLKAMKPGVPYRSDKIRSNPSNLQRDLAALTNESLLRKAAPGLYYKPKMLGRLEVPADKSLLVKEFLNVRSGEFLFRYLSDFHSLRLGTTQHSSKVYVYNKKRNGDFTLDGTLYAFRKRKFPKVLSTEYLLVDMLNSLKELGEDSAVLKKNVERRLFDMDLDLTKLLLTSNKYGVTWVKRYFLKLERDYKFST